MTQSYRDLTTSARRAAARATLSGLMAGLGDAGLDAASQLPGLLAEIDQHVAAVVEALCGQGHALGPVALAGYAAGVHDAATEQGWRVPDSQRLEWARADWPTVRLLAVASIARAASYV